MIITTEIDWEMPPWAGIANQRLIDHSLPDGQEEIGLIDRFLGFLHRHGQPGSVTLPRQKERKRKKTYVIKACTI